MVSSTPAESTIDATTLGWLLEGDPSVVWQVQRDLVDAPETTWSATRLRVATEGWGAQLLELRAPDGQWGGGLYQPKWTSTFYTLQLLVQLGIAPTHPLARESCRLLLREGVQPWGGVSLWRSQRTDVCVGAMLITMACNLGLANEPEVHRAVTHLCDVQLGDGGWNCDPRGTHSSFHTTLSAMEALHAYQDALGKDPALEDKWQQAHAFFLAHQLYRSHTTGEVVRASFARPHFPTRWFFDVLRCLEHLATAKAGFDPRLKPALHELTKRQRDGRWRASKHTGPVHFVLEPARQPSRVNTLRALRVMRWAATDVAQSPHAVE